uniref:Protein kinase domain-containing protein n=1 Tax=Caenorhabditis japonica TaxID=281687 RepID=A0A8R1I8X5_CAEJA
MMTASSIEVHNIHFEKKVEKVKVIDRSLHFTKYTGEMKFADGRVKEAMFEEAKNVDNEYMEKFFSKMVTVAALIEKHLPVRLPIAAFISPPTLIYDLQKENSGFPLSYILKHHDNLLDLTQRVKLCSSAVRVMSELHQADIFHGALIAKNFFLNFIRINDGVKEYELVFNGPSGLLFLGKSDCSVSLIDYDLNAPELAFTRKLTKESGVFNIGRLFEQILKTEILKTYQKNAPEDPPALREMRQMIARATRPNPYHRPTTNGIVMMIRETLKILPPSSAPVNFVHYDQFAI